MRQIASGFCISKDLVNLKLQCKFHVDLTVLELLAKDGNFALAVAKWPRKHKGTPHASVGRSIS